MRFNLRRLFSFVALLSVISLFVSYIVRLEINNWNAYALESVARMVVEHMNANDGRWPEDWSGLRDDFQTCVVGSGQRWRFEELKRRVQIDWNANPKELFERQTEGCPDFRVIQTVDGTDAHWAHSEPNQIILDYLNQRYR